MEPRDQLQRGLGSGFIVSSDGEILTNNHVVAGAEQIRVGLFQDDRKTYAATVLGRDPLTDSALIKLQDAPGNLPTAPLGNSDALEPGDWVMAIGNPFQLGHTVTVGVVSFRGRPFAVSEGRFQDMLQTDASINPGNSGGPLIDTRGEVVGINAAIFSEGGRGNIGIGFAVPINTVKALLPQLREGKVHRSRLGVRIQSIPMTDEEAASLGLPKPEGAIVSMVEPDSPAGHAGLGAGDVIVEFGGTTVTDGSQLTALVAAARPGSGVPIAYYRRGKRATTTATLDELVLEEERVESRGAAATTGFGLSLEDLPRDAARQLHLPAGTAGALVADVAPFTPAADAGIQPGDVILEVNRAPVRSARDTGTELRKVGPGKLAFLLVSRQGNQMFLEIRKG
jgi:serine protease Do